MLKELMPNFINYLDEFTLSLVETLQMMVIAGILIILVGGFIGIMVVVTKPQGILENKAINKFFDFMTNGHTIPNGYNGGFQTFMMGNVP